MIVSCSGCGNPTTPRNVPKGPNGPWVAWECGNGCMNGKYKLTTKPPKFQVGATQSPQGGTDAIKILNEILVTVKSLHTIVNRHVTLKDDPLEVQVDKIEGDNPFQ